MIALPECSPVAWAGGEGRGQLGVQAIELGEQPTQQNMTGRRPRALPGLLGTTRQQAAQAQQQTLRPAAVQADAVQPGRDRRQHMQVFDAAKRLYIGIPAVAGQPFARGLFQVQACMADIRHQRQARQRLDAHTRRAAVNHTQRQVGRRARRLITGGHQ